VPTSPSLAQMRSRPPLRSIRSGEMAATNTPFPYYQGCKAVEAALRHLTGQEVPAWVDSAPTLITKENVDKFFGEDGLVLATGSCQPPE